MYPTGKRYLNLTVVRVDTPRKEPLVATNPSFHITIDDTVYTTRDDDQQVSEVLRLADKDPKVFDLFRVKAGTETHVKDGQIIHLKDGDRFRARRKLRFTIDGARFTTYDDDMERAALLRLAGVNPAENDLARVGANGAVDTLSDDELVHISDGDKFVTAKRIGGVS